MTRRLATVQRSERIADDVSQAVVQARFGQHLIGQAKRHRSVWESVEIGCVHVRFRIYRAEIDQIGAFQNSSLGVRVRRPGPQAHQPKQQSQSR